MSFNHDIEGHTTDKSVLAAREEHKAWLMRQLMTSKGHKLLLAGDEFGSETSHADSIKVTVSASSVVAITSPND